MRKPKSIDEGDAFLGCLALVIATALSVLPAYAIGTFDGAGLVNARSSICLSGHRFRLRRFGASAMISTNSSSRNCFSS